MEFGQGDCGRPTCIREPQKTYRGPNGNTIRLCENCYYNAVVGSKSISTDGSIDNFPDMGGIDIEDLDEPINESGLEVEDIIGRHSQL